MKFSIENEIFIPGPSLAAEEQGLGLKCSIENEIFKPRMKISSDNENFVRGGMVFSCVRARMNLFDPRALWDFSRIFIFEPPDFFADFVAGFFLLIFVGKEPRKILQENPRENPPEFIQQKSSDTFLQIGRGKRLKKFKISLLD